MHRPRNVDNKKRFSKLINALNKINKKIKIVFPAHPRTVKMASRFGLSFENLKLIKPLGYLDFLNLFINCKFVITDSGGITEEATVLNIPCLTLREETERPITVSQGTNILVGGDPDKLIKESLLILNGKIKKGSIPLYWDGKTSRRIVDVIKGGK